MSDDDRFEDECAEGEVVCEFFGIKIITKNPNVARVLTADVDKIARLDVRDVKNYLRGEDNDDGIEYAAAEDDYSSDSEETGSVRSDLESPFLKIEPDIDNS